MYKTQFRAFAFHLTKLIFVIINLKLQYHFCIIMYYLIANAAKINLAVAGLVAIGTL